jgi:hypothetical protein
MHLSETFIDLSAHLGNLFVAIGTAELSKKMLRSEMAEQPLSISYIYDTHILFLHTA